MPGESNQYCISLTQEKPLPFQKDAAESTPRGMVKKKRQDVSWITCTITLPIHGSGNRFHTRNLSWKFTVFRNTCRIHLNLLAHSSEQIFKQCHQIRLAFSLSLLQTSKRKKHIIWKMWLDSSIAKTGLFCFLFQKWIDKEKNPVLPASAFLNMGFAFPSSLALTRMSAFYLTLIIFHHGSPRSGGDDCSRAFLHHVLGIHPSDQSFEGLLWGGSMHSLFFHAHQDHRNCMLLSYPP